MEVWINRTRKEGKRRRHIHVYYGIHILNMRTCLSSSLTPSFSKRWSGRKGTCTQVSGKCLPISSSAISALILNNWWNRLWRMITNSYQVFPHMEQEDALSSSWIIFLRICVWQEPCYINSVSLAGTKEDLLLYMLKIMSASRKTSTYSLTIINYLG